MVGATLTTSGVKVNSYSLTITDTAADIAANLDGLAASNIYSAIVVSDPANPIVITNAQFNADTRALNQIAGAYELKVTGIKNQPYASYLDTHNSDGTLASRTQYNTDGSVYLAFTQSQGDGLITRIYSGGSFFKKQSYDSETLILSQAGTKELEIYNNLDGTHTITGLVKNLTIPSIGNDKITGGAPGQTFLMQAGFGNDTITDFGTYLSNATPDTISFSTTEFADFTTMLAATVNTPKGARITAASGDILFLTGVTKSMVAASSANFLFTPGA